MANATETTKRAAVWNPPRFHKLHLHDPAVGSGTRTPPTTADWEGSKIWDPSSPAASPTRGYRMPNSSDPVPYPYPWQ